MLAGASVLRRGEVVSNEQAAGSRGGGPRVGGVLARQRQAIVLERVREEGAVRVTDLARLLGVSDMTVRRDLEFLQGRGLIEKVHGGATSIPGSALFEPGFATKSALQLAEKDAIADAAVELINPGAAIGISAGTTTYAIACRLVGFVGLTVVTNSLRVADVMSETRGSDQTVVLTGGVRTPSDALVGPLAVSALQNIHLDLVFMGVHGMDLGAGFTSPNLLEAETNRAMVDSARLLVIVADHTKWGVVGLSSFARLDQADILITDAGLDPAVREELAVTARRLIVVGVAVSPELKAVEAQAQGAGMP
jgi:DeoR/GlpR family transcriptional regulator of sugar metabolism